MLTWCANLGTAASGVAVVTIDLEPPYTAEWTDPDRTATWVDPVREATWTDPARTAEWEGD